MKVLLWITFAMAILAAPVQARTVGFEAILVPMPRDRPLKVGVWYPSDAAEAPARLGLDTQTVALNAAIAGKGYGLILMSHGTGGWYGSHDDTARALAHAGFVVASVSHTGDTFDDRSRATRMVDRAPQLSQTLDYMIQVWRGRDAIDRRRIGAFGFSSGGFTALVAIGGVPDLGLIAPHCVANPTYFDCNLVQQSGDTALLNGPWRSDLRIRAAVIAAPALGFTFAPNGLLRVKVPVQLWRAERDSVLPHPLYAEAVKDLLPRAPDYRVVEGADHYDFLAPCGPGLAQASPQVCKPGFDRSAFHIGFNSDVVAFFRKTLR